MDWDIIIKAIAVIATTATAIIGVSKYFYEKNRSWNERRLNEVYAPLYGLLVKQETMRHLYFPHITVEKAPILTSEKKTTNQSFQFSSEGVKVSSSESSGGAGILDRKAFIEILNNTNKGLARPKLLILINQYELLVYLEENTEKESEQWKKATTKKVEVENALFKEIQYGYEDTIRNLKLDDAGQIYNLETYFKVD